MYAYLYLEYVWIAMEFFMSSPCWLIQSSIPCRICFQRKMVKIEVVFTQLFVHPQATQACRTWFILSKIPKWGKLASTDFDMHQVRLIFTLYQNASKVSKKRLRICQQSAEDFLKEMPCSHATPDTKKSHQPFWLIFPTSFLGRRISPEPYIQLSVVPRHLDLSSAAPVVGFVGWPKKRRDSKGVVYQYWH